MNAARQAIIVTAGMPGQAGLGAAGAQASLGLTELGWEVNYIALEAGAPPTGFRHLAAVLPFRRSGRFRRWSDRHQLRARIPSSWDLAYAMPGFAPRRLAGRVVMHQGTHAPPVVVAQLKQARRRAGGGNTFMTAAEARLLMRELRAADLIRTESRAVFQELIELGLSEERLVHARPGVDLSRFHPGVRDPSTLRVAFVGSFSLWKGLDILVALGEELRASGAVLEAVGGPVCGWSRRTAANAGLQGRSDVAAVLGSANALVLPSASDGFGYVVLEAMAAGCVPIVSPEVGAAELVAELDPRLVVTRDAFVETVPKLLEQLPLESLGLRARGLAEEHDWGTMARAAMTEIVSRLDADVS